MKILLTGATGLIGKALQMKLKEQGHTLITLSRHELGNLQGLPPLVFEGVEAVIHLAGETISKRWTAKHKKAIYDSRILGTRGLLNGIRKMRTPKPKLFITASAVGYYGDRGSEELTEDSKSGSGFLADVCRDWEKELFANPIANPLNDEHGRMRSVALRFGVVLAKQGGALSKMLPVFKMGLGSPLGSGKQWMSWIHLEDAVGLFLHVLSHSELQGPINAVAPDPVTNKEFSAALAEALHRPMLSIGVPSFVLKMGLGEMATLLLSSQGCLPTKAVQSGYVFKYPTIAEAFRALSIS